MNNILIIGTEFRKGKGGVAAVIKEYHKLYPEARIISSTKSSGFISNLMTLFTGLCQTLFFFIFDRNISIVHIHGASYNSFTRKYLFFRLSKLFKKKVIYHIHGAEYEKFYHNSNSKKKLKIRKFINNSDCIVCLSQSWFEFFNQNFNPKKLEIIPNIIAQPENNGEQEMSSSGIRDFLFLGYIDKRKGIWDLIDIIQKNKSELAGKAIFRVGGNGETEKLQQRIKEYGLDNIVKFEGWVSGEKKQGLLRNTDVYILPSYNEGLPISILEAMSYSKPILSTTVGGIPEIVDAGNGILIEAGNKEQLWQSIQSFIHFTDEELTAMGTNSLKKAKPHFPESVFKKLNILYEQLVSE